MPLWIYPRRFGELLRRIHLSGCMRIFWPRSPADAFRRELEHICCGTGGGHNRELAAFFNAGNLEDGNDWKSIPRRKGKLQESCEE